jgi:hypothetical protein
VPNVTINRCSMPRPPGASPGLEHVGRSRRAADHVGRSGGAFEVGARELVHRLSEAEVRERVERRDHAGDHRLQGVLLRRAERRLAGAGGRGNGRDDGPGRLRFRLRELPAVGDEPFRAGLWRVVVVSTFSGYLRCSNTTQSISSWAPDASWMPRSSR